MILISVFTDVTPSLSMVNEKPEADLLLRKPRNRKTEHLVNGKLLLQVCWVGIVETTCAMVA